MSGPVPTRKRQRRGAAAAALVFEREAEFEFQIAPMADLLFVLLVFFMSITSLDSLRLEKRIALPAPPDAPRAEAAADRARHRAVIALGWMPGARAGSLAADGRAFSGPEPLLSWLQERRQADPALSVVIEADRSTPYARVAQVMRLCAAARIGAVTFAVADPASPEETR